jgi:hypothetical protein
MMTDQDNAEGTPTSQETGRFHGNKVMKGRWHLSWTNLKWTEEMGRTMLKQHFQSVILTQNSRKSKHQHKLKLIKIQNNCGSVTQNQLFDKAKTSGLLNRLKTGRYHFHAISWTSVSQRWTKKLVHGCFQCSSFFSLLKSLPNEACRQEPI